MLKHQLRPSGLYDRYAMRLIRIIAASILIASMVLAAYAQDNSAEYWIQRGKSFYQNGSYQQAVNCYSRAIGVQLGNEEAWKGQGMALAKSGRYKMARLSFDNALRANPMDPGLWLERAIVAEKLKDYSEAQES
ncbi:MAG: tetratricopeptide repeat protein, partial [Methanotrichaceae archaeon]|nr:tetratricopeptide repeat protein [Methanotrichaceae archaeon]